MAVEVPARWLSVGLCKRRSRRLKEMLTSTEVDKGNLKYSAEVWCRSMVQVTKSSRSVDLVAIFFKDMSSIEQLDPKKLVALFNEIEAARITVITEALQSPTFRNQIVHRLANAMACRDRRSEPLLELRSKGRDEKLAELALSLNEIRDDIAKLDRLTDGAHYIEGIAKRYAIATMISKFRPSDSPSLLRCAKNVTTGGNVPRTSKMLLDVYVISRSRSPPLTYLWRPLPHYA